MIDFTGLGERLVAFLESPGFPPIAILVAVLTGAVHSLGPGHGKSLAAAYLVGEHGRIRDAAWLAASVALMHTFSVLVLALAWTFFALSDLVDLAHLTQGMEIVAGLLVIAVGAWLVQRWFATSGHGHHHDHTHGHTHGHGAVEDHAHGHGHDHRQEPPSRPGLILLGMSGGLTPSPAAFLLLLTGFFSGRAELAFLLVVCFGLGMAVVLFAVGLIALSGKHLIVGALPQGGRAVTVAARFAPLAAAGGITVLGLGITVVATARLFAL